MFDHGSDFVPSLAPARGDNPVEGRRRVGDQTNVRPLSVPVRKVREVRQDLLGARQTCVPLLKQITDKDPSPIAEVLKSRPADCLHHGITGGIPKVRPMQ
jgi:hypothetical protein